MGFRFIVSVAAASDEVVHLMAGDAQALQRLSHAGVFGVLGIGGQRTDETTRKFVGDQMAALQKWIAGIRRMTGA